MEINTAKKELVKLLTAMKYPDVQEMSDIIIEKYSHPEERLMSASAANGGPYKWVKTGRMLVYDSYRDGMNKYALEMIDMTTNLLQQQQSLIPFSISSTILNDFTFDVPEPTPPKEEPLPLEPSESDAIYLPAKVKVSLFQKLIDSNAEADAQRIAKQQAHAKYENDHERWLNEVSDINKRNKAAFESYESNHKEWLIKKEKFDVGFSEVRDVINNAPSGDVFAIEYLYKRVVENISLPFDYQLIADVEYQPEQMRLVIDVDLPIVNDLPNVKSAKYIKSRNQIDLKYQSEAFMKRFYNDTIYKLVMLIIYHGFAYKEFGEFVESIVLNGFVKTVDPASGKKIHPCILSVITNKDSFEEVVLDSVDAKAWFRSVKGVSAAKIEMSTPVPPIVTMNKTDHRFVDSYEVANQLDSSTNLASMDWKDFENLVREIFEEEFKVNGGEVKVTQASRDGGVDAIAFDPDPIRGGKIVIQAKRYTNVVGVSAVRDLYGTVLNEGANKGILVTTSGYGNDAYDFAKDKPITLLDGGNLLSLLEKHGHHARINIKEAKEML